MTAAVALIVAATLTLTVHPRVLLAPASVRIKVQREPQPAHRWLHVAVLDEAGIIRASSIDLSEEPRRQTWDYLWEHLPPCDCEVVAQLEPTGERATVTLTIR